MVNGSQAMHKKILIAIVLMLFSTAVMAKECVILLHGLARSSASMKVMAKTLTEADYIVVNVDYPSRKFPIEELAQITIPKSIEQCHQGSSADHPVAINFVSHSLGGILIRQYLEQNTIPELKRVVMLGPPNKGSQVVDRMKGLPGFKTFNGQAGLQLGTDKDSVPSKLGPVKFELGVIAGTRSINLLLSNYLPNPDDGKVSLENTKVEGMCSFISIPVSHPYIMKDKDVIVQVLLYLKSGRFTGDTAVNTCGDRYQTAEKDSIAVAPLADPQLKH